MESEFIEQMRSFALGSNRPKRKQLPGPTPTLSLAPSLEGEIVLAKHDGVIKAKANCRKCENRGFIDGPDGSRRCECTVRIRPIEKAINALRAPWVHREASQMGDACCGIGEHLSSTVRHLSGTEGHAPFTVIHGPSGLGKSFVACWAGFAACMRGRDARWVMAEQVIEHVKRAYGEGGSLGAALEPYVKADLLILDELKRFRGEHGSEVISHLLRRRWDAEERTIITTNLGMRGIVSAVDEQMAYRLTRAQLCPVSAPKGRGVA